MGARTCCRMIPFGSLIATCVAVAGCIVFFVNYDQGVTKFIDQINTIAREAQQKDLINFSTKAITIPISISFSALSVAFLLSSVICTVIIARFYYSNVRSYNETCFTRIFANPVIVAITIVVAYVLLWAWAVMLCAAAFIAALYIGFISVVDNICAKVLNSNGCIDLKDNPLVKDIIEQLSGMATIPDLQICTQNYGKVCGKENDETWTFVAGFIACFVALIGIVHFLMCMSANFARLLAMRREHVPTVHMSPFARSVDEIKPYTVRPEPAPRRVYPETDNADFLIRRPVQMRY